MPNDAFAADLAALPARIPSQTCRNEWQRLYDARTAGLSPLGVQLLGQRPVLLALVDEAEAAAECEWPGSVEACRTLLLLTSKGEHGVPPADLLRLNLDEVSFNVQLWLRRCAPRVVEEVIRFATEYQPHIEARHAGVAWQLLVHTTPEDGVPLSGLADHAAEFVTTHREALMDRIFNADWRNFPLGTIIEQPHQKVFDFYHRFRVRCVADLPSDDPFYDRDFADLLRFAPLITWVQGQYNGLGAPEDIVLGDENWRHLATGGSWRKLPDGRPVSRGMAKLLSRPYGVHEFFGNVDDRYLAAYVVNLIDSSHVGVMAVRHLRRFPDDPAAQQAEFDRWHDVLQVLRQIELAIPFNDRFEFFSPLLEYIALRLRDQPDYSITGYTAERLQQEVELAHQRREARAAARRRQEEAGSIKADPAEPWQGLPCHEQVTGQDDEGRAVKFFELLDQRALAAEAAAMGNCVDGQGYVNACRNSNHHIFSLRSLGDGGKWYSRATIHITASYDAPYNYHLQEARARFNQDLNDWMKPLLRQWLEANDISYC